MERITSQLVRQMLPPRRADGHKGTFGRVYIYGGCVGYTGAPVYAGEAAVRTGSGLVFVGVPEEIYPIAAVRCRDAMVQPLPEDDGELLERMNACDAVLIGPGLGREPGTERRVLYLMERLSVPVVLDADGINAVSAHIDELDGRRRNGNSRRRPSPGGTAVPWSSRGRAPSWPAPTGGPWRTPPATAVWPRAAAATSWRG